MGSKIMLNFFREEDYEKSLIELFQNDLEYEYVYGPDIERDFYSPFYEDVLIKSLYRINLQEKRIEFKAFRWFSSFVLETYLIITIEKT